LDNIYKNERGSRNHGACSIGSSIKLFLLKSVLEMLKVRLILFIKNNLNQILIIYNSFLEENPDLESDYQLMMSSCNDVVSATVPNELREISKS